MRSIDSMNINNRRHKPQSTITTTTSSSKLRSVKPRLVPSIASVSVQQTLNEYSVGGSLKSGDNLVRKRTSTTKVDAEQSSPNDFSLSPVNSNVSVLLLKVF